MAGTMDSTNGALPTGIIAAGSIGRYVADAVLDGDVKGAVLTQASGQGRIGMQSRCDTEEVAQGRKHAGRVLSIKSDFQQALAQGQFRVLRADDAFEAANGGGTRCEI